MPLRETQAIIERVRRIDEHWQHIELVVEPVLNQIQPGQTLLARSEGLWSSYLRELWIPIGFDENDGTLLVERPLTKSYQPGDIASVIGPVGAPLPLKPTTQQLLLVAMDHPPTYLLFMMLQAIKRGVSITLVMTASARQYPMGNIPNVVEVVYSEHPQQWANQVQTLRWADQVFAVTSPIFLEANFRVLREAALTAIPTLADDYLLGIYDLPQPCGTGACMACMVPGKHRDRLTCLDGVALDLTKVRL
jgi:hypothetical protein